MIGQSWNFVTILIYSLGQDYEIGRGGVILIPIKLNFLSLHTVVSKTTDDLSDYNASN